jgi:hypothetical protein
MKPTKPEPLPISQMKPYKPTPHPQQQRVKDFRDIPSLWHGKELESKA